MRKVLFPLFIFLLSLAIGCSSTGTTTNNAPPDAAQTAQTENKELVVAGQEIAASLDPVKPLTSAYLRNLGAAEALFRVSADGKIEPSLAESVKQLDAKTWEIKLRPEVRFWSGKAVDANAVIASLARSRELDVQAEPFLANLSFSAVDDFTVKVITEGDNLPVPLNLSYYQTVIHNAEAKHDAVETMDLTGMYKVTAFTPKQKMVLERNERYWGQKPAIRRVVHEEIPDGQTRVMSVLGGHSQIALNIPVTSMSQFNNREDVSISAAPVANTQTIYLNLNKPQLADERVRQALAWALDREELVTLAAEGQSVPVATWLGSNPVFAEAKNAVYTKADDDKANRLLDEAGWTKGADGVRVKDGQPLKLRLMTWGGDKALGEALQNQWSKLGMTVEVQHGDYSLIETARETGDWDASIEAWSTFGDTYSLLSGQFSPAGSANYGGYADEETNRLLAELKTAADAEESRDLALQINERVALQAPVIALFPRPQLTAVSKSLTGFEEHFRQFENTINANLVFSK